jgi:aspartyl-tRNA(Asn)/glutamyl-tRNA(Gln) amidotransferase subunit B
LREGLPELPLERESRFIDEYKLPAREAKVLTSERKFSDYSGEVFEIYPGQSKNAANWLINDVLGLMNELHLSAGELFLTPERLAEILKLVDEGVINTSTGKELVRKTQKLQKEPREIVEEEGLAQVTDSGAIESICLDVIQENPSQVEQYKSGKGGVIGWLIGQVMAKSGGKANPQLVREILESLMK